MIFYSINYIGYGSGGINRDCFLCLIEERSLYMWRIRNVNLKKHIGKVTIERIKSLTLLAISYQLNIRCASLKETLLNNDTTIKNIMIYNIYSSYLIHTKPEKELWSVRKLVE